MVYLRIPEGSTLGDIPSENKENNVNNLTIVDISFLSSFS